MKPPVFTFRPLVEADLTLLHEWLNRPHVLEWWEGGSSPEEVHATYVPSIQDGSVRGYLACLEAEPVGYIQSYPVLETADGWWVGYSDPSVMGIDQFVADPARVGQGLGAAMAAQFAAMLFENPDIHRLQVDPHPDNARAIRCYEKAGFAAQGRIITPDGDAWLMTMERPA